MIIKYLSNPDVVSITPGVIAISENVRLVARERTHYNVSEMVVYQERRGSHTIVNEFLIAGIDWGQDSEEVHSHVVSIDGMKNVFDLNVLKEMAKGMSWVALEKEV